MTKTRLLIVEDQPALRHVLYAYLKPLGWIHIAGEASTGQEAIESAWTLAPDIILMDLTLSDMSGLYATRNILQDGRRTPIILCSDDRDSTIIHDAFKTGALGYMWKATNRIELEKAIRCVLNGDQYLDPVFKLYHCKPAVNNEMGSDQNAISR